MQEESKVATSNFNHTPVLANELIQLIAKLPENLKEQGLMLDATVGGGGHSSLVLKEFPSISVIGLDQDPEAIKAASQKLKIYKNRAKVNNINFANFNSAEKFCAVFADLGVSSPQLDEATRGFSFQKDGPLDMRMNPFEGITAADLIDDLSERDLADIIFKYGEERLSRRIAKKIKDDLANKGAYSGTKSLAYAISGCYPQKLRHRRIHPATKTFQALRIAINKELDVLSLLLKKAPEWILPGGIFAIISFHSLEDRLVKHAFKNDDRLDILTRKPILASNQEISLNPRSRSAKLRISQKI
ncbi:16S rRNA (cytosine(1402)-N(4))-methyltransferase RsmH [Prochlorococcus sp. MIT 0601]|uniref:16S rRNA (cytosine(1402)-N(4))-methyltransferase RsmH n=1 Tax=Prochlorococcus sp. MIT 0601 TaxID=1499498 RepID=UPI000533BCC1|nr:16S rRNA (cytosine(1402)-N(4))-methyltransferase RsmH [Prochlorococcus sp. MIT 0601]KGG13201.1 rRNA small subunit methyltransferase H [Prochlorococcus sp. MIT 0601]